MLCIVRRTTKAMTVIYTAAMEALLCLLLVLLVVTNGASISVYSKFAWLQCFASVATVA